MQGCVTSFFGSRAIQGNGISVPLPYTFMPGSRAANHLSILVLPAALVLLGCGSGSNPSGTGAGAGGSSPSVTGGGGSSADASPALRDAAADTSDTAHDGGRAADAGTADGVAGAGGTSDGAAEAGGTVAFTLSSNTLADGAMFPIDSTCETTMAASQMPDLRWRGAPAGTRSFAMAFVDVSLIPGNTNGYHSVLWDVPATAGMLPYGLPAGSPPAGIAELASVKQKKAPSGAAWLGPCPNFPSTARTRTDMYQFRLYALAVDTLPANVTSLSVAGMVTAIEALAPLETAVLSGRSNAAATMLK